MSSPPPEDDRTIIRPPQARQPAPEASAASSAGDSGNALPVGTFLGEFELNKVLGEGGFGIVYLAWDSSLERRVALKEYMPSSLAARSGQTQVQVKSERHRETFDMGLKSFVNEAKLLAQFDHPALVKVHRFWEANGTAYMVMPFYEGTTLKDRLRELPAAPDEAWLMALLSPLTGALAVVHSESCFHRDIAPDNVILLAGSGQPLLLDFGAARRVIGDMTQALTVILKPGYAPVEQYAEAPSMKQGPWTDVYALAATVHFAITGKTPPPSVSRLVGDSYVPLAESQAGKYSANFLEAIDRALGVKPDERTQSIDLLRVDLGLPASGSAAQSSAGFDGGSTVLMGGPANNTGPRTVAPSQGRKTEGDAAPSKGRGALIGGVVAAVVVVAAAAFFLMPADKPDAAQNAAATSSPAATPTGAETPPAETVPAAPTPVQAPAPPARPFSIEDEFDKVVAAQTAGYAVEATAAKAQLRIGRDRLKFSIKSSQDGYLQVLVLGPDGSLLQFYPNSSVADNRVRAGQTITLPQGSWPIDTVAPAGAEHFLAIVSKNQRDYSALGNEREYLFLKLIPGKVAERVSNQAGGSAPSLLGMAKGCTDVSGCDDFAAARFTIQVVD